MRGCGTLDGDRTGDRVDRAMKLYEDAVAVDLTIRPFAAAMRGSTTVRRSALSRRNVPASSLETIRLYRQHR